MAKRWDTSGIAGWGAMAGLVVAGVKLMMPHQGEILSDGIAPLTAYVGGGAIGGAALFALVSGARNLLLRAR